jgi:2-aminoadipate transaminase
MEYQYADRLKNLEGNAIRDIFKLLDRPEIISFAGGMPATSLLPVRQFLHLTQELLQSEKAWTLLQYGATEGYSPLFESAFEYAERFGLSGLKRENALVISGGQQGIDLTSKLFLNKGETVLVEDPSYLAALQIFKTYEANIIGVNSEDDGLNIADLEEKIARFKPKLLYIVPTFSNPTGKELSLPKRKKIAEITAKAGVMVLEDDPYSELRFEGERIPSIKSFDTTGNVLFNMSFSKTISPGIRVGLIIGNKEVIRKLTIAKQGTDVHTPTLTQAAVDRFVRYGYIDKAIEDAKPVYKAKKDAMVAAMEKYFPKQIKFTRPKGGMFIWVELPSYVDAVAMFPQAVERNVAYVIGTPFFADGSGHNTLRLNYSNASGEQIEKGIKSLGELLHTKIK